MVEQRIPLQGSPPPKSVGIGFTNLQIGLKLTSVDIQQLSSKYYSYLGSFVASYLRG